MAFEKKRINDFFYSLTVEVKVVEEEEEEE